MSAVVVVRIAAAAAMEVVVVEVEVEDDDDEEEDEGGAAAAEPELADLVLEKCRLRAASFSTLSISVSSIILHSLGKRISKRGREVMGNWRSGSGKCRVP